MCNFAATVTEQPGRHRNSSRKWYFPQCNNETTMYSSSVVLFKDLKVVVLVQCFFVFNWRGYSWLILGRGSRLLPSDALKSRRENAPFGLSHERDESRKKRRRLLAESSKVDRKRPLRPETSDWTTDAACFFSSMTVNDVNCVVWWLNAASWHFTINKTRLKGQNPLSFQKTKGFALIVNNAENHFSLVVILWCVMLLCYVMLCCVVLCYQIK